MRFAKAKTTAAKLESNKPTPISIEDTDVRELCSAGTIRL
ncbi:hypothetical protein CEV34_1923 [Brucella pseudogrignonensis]|uniref:Uncharacterized protein n=1 Tax=Brucella pseudogrignonensis TaxID=419475 RepID=A0A256GLF1_9HYPH|nr:hypothetical protein CEV34_1923 [Brucella pseudogrignonensis]